MDNTAIAGAELTCALGCPRAGRVYVGAADGSVRAVAANATTRGDESGRGAEGDGDGKDLPLTHASWKLRVCAQAVTSVCGVEAGDEDKLLLLVGSAGGELVVLRGELEVRRFQLESAVQQICYDDQAGEFIVGDALGNLYGVTQYEILWKRRLPARIPREESGAECFYPAVAQPSVRAIAHAKLLDVEKTQSNYVLVATGQKHLLVTHRGKDFSVIPTRTPVVALASCSAGAEDVVLASGEEGVIYRLVSYCDTVQKDMPGFRFGMEVWAQVSFPVAKLMTIKTAESATDTNPDGFAWICLGVDGEVALFRGKDRVKQWSAASFGRAQNVDLDFPVDFTILNGDDASKTHQSGAIVFPDRIHVFPIELPRRQ